MTTHERVLEHVQSAIENLERVSDVHGNVEAVPEEHGPTFSVSIAIDALSDAEILLTGVDSVDDDPLISSTIMAALLHYGLSCYDGRLCVQALKKLGEERAAEALDRAFTHRVYSSPGVREWGAEVQS